MTVELQKFYSDSTSNRCDVQQFQSNHTILDIFSQYQKKFIISSIQIQEIIINHQTMDFFKLTNRNPQQKQTKQIQQLITFHFTRTQFKPGRSICKKITKHRSIYHSTKVRSLFPFKWQNTPLIHSGILYNRPVSTYKFRNIIYKYLVEITPIITVFVWSVGIVKETMRQRKKIPCAIFANCQFHPK